MKRKKYTHETSPTTLATRAEKNGSSKKYIYRTCKATNKKKIYTVSFIFHFYYDVLTPRSTCWLIIIFHMIMLRFLFNKVPANTEKNSLIKASHAFNYLQNARVKSVRRLFVMCEKTVKSERILLRGCCKIFPHILNYCLKGWFYLIILWNFNAIKCEN